MLKDDIILDALVRSEKFVVCDLVLYCKILSNLNLYVGNDFQLQNITVYSKSVNFAES